MRQSPWLALALGLLAAGCRPDLGPSEYDKQETFPDGGSGKLPGPDPYKPGDKRLSLSIFYEGDWSDNVPLDGIVANFYVYDMTALLQADPEHIEGLSSTRVTHAITGYLGFGVHWTPARDMRPWTKLHVSFRSKDAFYAGLRVGMNNDSPYTVDASAYGFAIDDAWHSLVIPLADLAAKGLDLSQVVDSFVINCDVGPINGDLLIDDVFFSAD
jgi:hypothetical protein